MTAMRFAKSQLLSICRRMSVSAFFKLIYPKHYPKSKFQWQNAGKQAARDRWDISWILSCQIVWMLLFWSACFCFLARTKRPINRTLLYNHKPTLKYSVLWANYRVLFCTWPQTLFAEGLSRCSLWKLCTLFCLADLCTLALSLRKI